MPERRIGRGRPQLATAWRTARCWNPACQPAAAREPASCARLTRLLLSSDLLRVSGWSVLR